MPMSTLAEQIAMQAMNRGWAESDSSITVRLQEEQAGVEVRAPHVDPARAGRFITTHPGRRVTAPRTLSDGQRCATPLPDATRSAQ